MEPLPEATVLPSPKSTQRRFAGLLRRSPTSAQFYHHFFMSRTRADDAFVLIDRSGQVPSTAIKTCLPSSHPSLQQTSVFSSARHSPPTPMCLCAACTHCQRTSQKCSCTYPYTFAECPRKTNSAVHIFTVTSQISLQPATPPSPSDRATPWALSLSLGRLIVRYLGHRPNFSISFHLFVPVLPATHLLPEPSCVHVHPQASASVGQSNHSAHQDTQINQPHPSPDKSFLASGTPHFLASRLA